MIVRKKYLNAHEKNLIIRGLENKVLNHVRKNPNHTKKEHNYVRKTVMTNSSHQSTFLNAVL